MTTVDCICWRAEEEIKAIRGKVLEECAPVRQDEAEPAPSRRRTLPAFPPTLLCLAVCEWPNGAAHLAMIPFSGP